ncbi:unnamed protein product, partial [Brassica rapa subsp. trilocularis]
DRKRQYVPCKKLLCFVSSEVTACVICFTFVFEVLPNQIQLVYNILLSSHILIQTICSR